MEIEKLNEWNPWWGNKDLIKNLTGSHRAKSDFLIDSINIKDMIIITKETEKEENGIKFISLWRWLLK